jgi:uncharacterized damage-inducible protein DinB
MFTSIQSFVEQWKNESTATTRILNTLTDGSLSQRVAPENRTLGRIAWHIPGTIHEMVSRTGLKFDAVDDEHNVPESAAAIADAYRRTGQALVDAIQSQWTDENLLESSNMYGEQWPNGLTLYLLISHEIHHRGQMTVLMRQAGLRVPGIYGPALEEWLERGATPPVV